MFFHQSVIHPHIWGVIGLLEIFCVKTFMVSFQNSECIYTVGSNLFQPDSLQCSFRLARFKYLLFYHLFLHCQKPLIELVCETCSVNAITRLNFHVTIRPVSIHKYIIAIRNSQFPKKGEIFDPVMRRISKPSSRRFCMILHCCTNETNEKQRQLNQDVVY